MTQIAPAGEAPVAPRDHALSELLGRFYGP